MWLKMKNWKYRNYLICLLNLRQKLMNFTIWIIICFLHIWLIIRKRRHTKYLLEIYYQLKNISWGVRLLEHLVDFFFQVLKLKKVNLMNKIKIRKYFSFLCSEVCLDKLLSMLILYFLTLWWERNYAILCHLQKISMKIIQLK